ncbi:MAG: AraC family transcriptional regulator [Firmicutes bacterium]|nr:AraC family transcriptional regulator [Bacillota bacterium]
MEKLQLIWSGETELPAGWELQPHTHDFFHLAYVRSGNLVFRAGGVDYHLSEGSLILIPPFVVHGIPQDTHNLCIQYEIFFRIQNPELNCFFENQKVFVLHGAPHLENLFSYIYMTYSSSDPLQSSSVSSFLWTILFSFLTDQPSSENSSEGYVDSSRYSLLVQNIIRYVEKNYDVKYDLTSLACALGFNKNYLCTVFRRETGITISEYFNYHRIRKVLIFLQYTGYNKEVPIHELAHQCGFADSSYFNRVFKKLTGMTPIEFINALSRESDGPEWSSFKKYYIEYLDMKRYPIQESLQYMRGLKAAAEINEK